MIKGLSPTPSPPDSRWRPPGTSPAATTSRCRRFCRSRAPEAVRRVRWRPAAFLAAGGTLLGSTCSGQRCSFIFMSDLPCLPAHPPFCCTQLSCTLARQTPLHPRTLAPLHPAPLHRCTNAQRTDDLTMKFNYRLVRRLRQEGEEGARAGRGRDAEEARAAAQGQGRGRSADAGGRGGRGGSVGLGRCGRGRRAGSRLLPSSIRWFRV